MPPFELLIPLVLFALALLTVARLLIGPVSESVEDTWLNWHDRWRQAELDAAARKQERAHRRASASYRHQAERARQEFYRAFDEEIEREQHRQEGFVGGSVDEEVVQKAEHAQRQKARLHVIRQRTTGCCNLILTARHTIYDGDPALHPLCRRAQARALHYLDRFREHLYASPLLEEDATIAQTALIAEGARRVCAQCPLRDSSISDPSVPCETVKAFNPAGFQEEPSLNDEGA